MKRNFDVNNFITKLQQNCKLSIVKEFEADEIITTFLLRRNQFCILIEGEAQLITYDKEGNKKIKIPISFYVYPIVSMISALSFWYIGLNEYRCTKCGARIYN